MRNWVTRALCAVTILGVIAATGIAMPGLVEEDLPRRDAAAIASGEAGPSNERYEARNTDGQDGSGGRATAYRAGGRSVAAPPAHAGAPEALLWRTPFGSWEPTVGVNDRGTVFFSSRNANVDPGVARSRDGGLTWQSAGPPEHRVSLDPYVWVDRPTGRLFASDVDPSIVCSPVSYSDDEGDTWKTSRACGVSDHQSLFGGPPRPGQTKPKGYDNALYYCAIGKGATTVAPTEAGCLRSLDGGDSWQVAGTAFPPRVNGTRRCGGFHGHGTVGPDGTVYLPAGWCGKPHLAISRDQGATWDQVQVSGVGARSHEAGIAADADNNLYYTWIGSDEKAYLSVSRDAGYSWGPALDITPPGVFNIDGFAASVDAGDPGRLAIVFMGTADENPVESTVWNAYVVTTVTALTPDPLFYGTTINDPQTNALHRGSSCCGNVGDFIDVAIGPEGTAWAALVDTCTGPGDACVYDETGLVTEPRGQGVVGQVVGGPPLIGAAAEQRPQIQLAAADGCVDAVSARVRRPARGRVRHTTLTVDGRRTRVVRGRRAQRRLAVRGLSAGTHRVRIDVETTAGRTFSATRTYRVCA